MEANAVSSLFTISVPRTSYSAGCNVHLRLPVKTCMSVLGRGIKTETRCAVHALSLGLGQEILQPNPFLSPSDTLNRTGLKRLQHLTLWRCHFILEELPGHEVIMQEREIIPALL